MSAVSDLAGVVAKAITLIQEAVTLLKIKVDEHHVELELMRTTMEKLEKDNMSLHSRIAAAEREVAQLTRRVQGF